MSDLDREKQKLRRAMREHVNAARAEMGAAGDAIIRALLADDLWTRAASAMAYLASPGEISLDALWTSGGPGPRLAAPRVDWDAAAMTPLVIDDPVAQTETRRHGIREPLPGRDEIDPAELGLVLVPGVAFDPAGGRLGRGGGFYDRFLPRATGATLIGVCWSAQVLPRVPMGPQDVRVHMLLTERGLRACKTPDGDLVGGR